MSKAIEYVKALRDKVIAAYRLTHVNRLVQIGQELASELRRIEKRLTENTTRVSELDANKWHPPVTEANGRKSPEDLIAEARADLTKTAERLTADKEKITKSIAENDAEIIAVETGSKSEKTGKRYAMNREEISEKVNALILSGTSEIEPAEFFPKETTDTNSDGEVSF